MANFLVAYLFTIFIETLVIYLLLRKKYDWKIIVRNGIIGSSITLPFVWFVFPLLNVQWIIFVLVSETWAFGGETILYKHLFKGIGLKEAMVISFLANLVSFVIGFLIL